jgi:hypothetical protein
MGFADAYLQKAGLRKTILEPESHPELQIIVTIPVYNESGLERCLDSLFQCTCAGGTRGPGVRGTGPSGGSGGSGGSGRSGESDGSGGSGSRDIRAEVLILINASADAPGKVLEQNRQTMRETLRWIRDHPHPCIDFHAWLDHSFDPREAGVGTARKVLMDEAVRRFNSLDRPDGIIASMDADAVVQPNYLEALVSHFHPGQPGGGIAYRGGHARGGRYGSSGPDGCSVHFEHPLSDRGNPGAETFPPEVYHAITRYELHQRYYLQSVRFTGYPYAFHTVGSSFAVRAGIYCMEGGMNRRQGGEDFYFIQKVAQRGNFNTCNATCVVPSPRPSDRVPFGTGPVVGRLIAGSGPLLTYNPRPFGMLRELFAGIEWPELLRGTWTEPLGSFLMEQEFEAALDEIQANSASASAFRKRFWRWFNMFRILKFIHFARERGYPDIPVGDAAAELLRILDPAELGVPSVGNDVNKLLRIYRMLEMR